MSVFLLGQIFLDNFRKKKVQMHEITKHFNVLTQDKNGSVTTNGLRVKSGQNDLDYNYILFSWSLIITESF